MRGIPPVRRSQRGPEGRGSRDGNYILINRELEVLLSTQINNLGGGHSFVAVEEGPKGSIILTPVSVPTETLSVNRILFSGEIGSQGRIAGHTLVQKSVRYKAKMDGESIVLTPYVIITESQTEIKETEDDSKAVQSQGD